MIELTLRASRSYQDPFHDVMLDVTFTEPGGRQLRVPAFWAGGNVWKVRYASSVVGTHRYQSDYQDAGDAGLHGASGSLEVMPYRGSNPLLMHGPLRAAGNRRFLEHTDGTPFFWLGDTWWMGLCHRLHWPDEFERLAADRRAKGFNVVQIVAGLYPDMPPFDPRGANEAGFPWEPGFARIRPAYFDAADQRIEHLVEAGPTPCIVGAWGYFLPLMGVEKAKQHWRYLVARYGALPVVWCVAGEANLPYYLAPGFPYDDREQVKGWTEVTRYLRAMDPFHRLITIHPTGIGRLSARHATDDVSLLDIDMLQTPHGAREAVAPAVHTVRESFADRPVLPVINGEASYEMLNDSLPTEWTRRMFWLCVMNGAAGHTYGANGIWQCNRREQAHGASPHGGNYGKIPWDEAMNLPGSRQMGLGKKLLEQYPWQRFQPLPGGAEFTAATAVRLDGCQWIWFPEGDPLRDAPAAKRFFRRNFVLEAGRPVAHAALRVSADDRFAARLNGHALGRGAGWHNPEEFDVTSLLKAGTNVVAIEAANMPAPAANPAGLIACLELRFTGGGVQRLVTDASWRCSTSQVPGWDVSDFDDAAWPHAMALAPYGGGPWGTLDESSADPAYGPQSCGIAGEVHVTYVPDPKPIVVLGLDPHAAYAAIYFDPVQGGKIPFGPIRSDTAGQWYCAPPAGQDHDWVLILEHAPVGGGGRPRKARSRLGSQ